MDFAEFDDEAQFRSLWNAVDIVRTIPYSLFTFGDSDLRYILVIAPEDPAAAVKIREGEITISRPLIITRENARPEFLDFFESAESDSMIQYLMARSAAFSNLKVRNAHGPERIVSDQVEEVVERLNRQLDADEEDRIAILVAPEKLAGVALVRFAAERIMASASDNLNELRERGFLE